MYQNAKLANTDKCGRLEIVAGIIGWNYMHNLGRMEEKKKDGETAFYINYFRERKGMV